MTAEEKQEFTDLKHIRAERYWTPNEALRFDVLLKKQAESFRNKIDKFLHLQKQIEQN
jgi:hypothetical protein